jgi:AcrR family transcriptional regulator
LQIQRTGLLVPSRERIREAAKRLFAERGYEATSTAAIARLAGTSESQLVKHFEGKKGLLEAVFQYSWEQINPALALALESVPMPREKFKLLVEMVLNFLAKDEELRRLFLLEGRRVHSDGKNVVMVPGFLEFIHRTDAILSQLAEQGELAVPPQALRSALMGALEGMMRDKILAGTNNFPAEFSDADIRTLCFIFFSATLRK